MSTKRILVSSLILAMTLGPAGIPLGAMQGATGSISGTAKDEASKPFSDFTVRARNIDTGSIANTISLDTKGQFTLTLDIPGNYLIELYNIKSSEIVCVEGPFALTPTKPTYKDVRIDCGKPVGAWWLLAVAGVASGAAAVNVNSASK